MAKALYKARYYISGHSNSHIVTDHKPLVSFMENTEINQVENRRLENLRRKCKNYNFKISYNPGTDNTADPLSRGKNKAHPWK